VCYCYNFTVAIRVKLYSCNLDINTSAVGGLVITVNINKIPNGGRVYFLFHLTTQRYRASNGKVINAKRSVGRASILSLNLR
jgi:hypothetical protein